MEQGKELNAIEVLDETLNIQKFEKFIDTLTTARLEIESRYSYNILKTLKLETDETKLHSAFIAHLLDPEGSHKQKDKDFLKLFLETICNFEKNDKRFNEKIHVGVEYSIGKINKEKTEGGRIDILIKGESFIIVIENKIYAEDQQNQLLRYHNYLKDKPSPKLYYLTLFGDDASENSTGKTNFSYERISYQKDILSWLNECQVYINKITNADKDEHTSRLKLAIIQYQEIVERLLGSSIIKVIRGEIMNENRNINETFLQTENLRTLKILHQNFGTITKEIIYKIVQNIIEKLGKKKNDVIIVPTTEKNSYIWDIQINPPFNLRFKYTNSSLYYGVSCENNLEENTNTREFLLRKELEQFGFKEKSSDFLCKKETYITFNENKTLCEDINEEIKKIVENCDKIINCIRELN